MKELFETQLNNNRPLDQYMLATFNNSQYFNDEDYKKDDVILMAFLIGTPILKENEIPELSLKIISLNERHFDLFDYDQRYQSYATPSIPVIKLKRIK